MVEEVLQEPEQQQEPTQQDPPKKKLWSKLNGSKLYTKSYEDFEKQFSTPESIDKLYGVLNQKQLYTKTSDDFKNQFFQTEQPKKKSARVDFEGSSLEAGNALSQSGGVGGTEIPTVEDNAISASKEYRRLKNAVKPVSDLEMGMSRGTAQPLPDEDKRKEADKLQERYKDYNLEEVGKEFEDFPEEAFTWKNEIGEQPFSQKRLLELRKENPVKYNDILSGVKTQYDIAKKTGDWNEANRFINLKTSRNVDEAVSNIEEQRNIINRVFDTKEEREKANERIRASAYVINPSTPGFEESYNNSGLSSKLTPSEYAGLLTLKAYEPEKYEQTLAFLNTPIKDIYIHRMPLEVARNIQAPVAIPTSYESENPEGGRLSQTTIDQKIGMETRLRELASIGRDNEIAQLDKTNKELGKKIDGLPDGEEKNNLINAYNDNVGKMNNIIQDWGNDDKRFPLTTEMKLDRQIADIIGKEPGLLNTMALKFAIQADNPRKSFYNLFGDSPELQMQRVGESQSLGQYTYLPEELRRVNSPVLTQYPKEVEKQIKDIYADKTLNETEKKEMARKILFENQDKITTVTNSKTGSKNFFSKATAYTMAGFLGDIGGMAFAMAANPIKGKPGEMIGLGSLMHNNHYTHAVEEGIKDPNGYANLHTGIDMLAATFGTQYDLVKEAVSKSPSLKNVFEQISKSKWDEVVSKDKNIISKAATSIKNSATSNAKIVALWGGGVPAIHQAADNVLYNKNTPTNEIISNSVNNMEEFAIGQLPLFFTHAYTGYKRESNLRKSMLWEIGDNHDIKIQRIKEQEQLKELTPQEAKERIANVTEIANLIKEVPKQDAKGKELTDEQRVEYLYNLYVKNKANSEKSLPEEQKKESEKTGMVADYRNELILNPPKDLEKEKLQNQIDAKDENGKPVLPEKEMVKAKAKLEAIDITIKEREDTTKSEEKLPKLSEPIEGVDEFGVPIGENVPPEVKGKPENISKPIELSTELKPNEGWSKDVESTAKALEVVDSNFTADLSDSKLSIDEKKKNAQKQIKDNQVTNDAAYSLISRALEKVDGLSVNNIFDLAKKISNLDNKPILIEHIAEAIQYEVGRVKNEKDAFSLSIEDAKDVLLNWSKDAEPANKTRMDEIGIVGKTYRDRINKLKVAKNQYEKLNEQGKALVKSFLNRYNDTIIEDAKLNTDEYLQILLDITKSNELVDVAENIQKSVQKIDDKEAIQLSKLPPIKEPLKNRENTQEALRRFSSEQLSKIPLYDRKSIVRLIGDQIKKSKQVTLNVLPILYNLPNKVATLRLNSNGEVDLLDANDKKISGKKISKEEFINIAVDIGNSQRKDAYTISEAYHKAKADGSNPELVKAVEDVLGTTKETNRTIQQNTSESKGQETETTISETTEPTRSGEPETTTTVLEPEEPTTSIKNATTASERKSRGLDEIEVEARRSFPESFEEGKRLVDSGELDARSLAKELAKKPRALNAEETTALLYDRMRISNEHEVVSQKILEAQEKGNEAAVEALHEKLAQVEMDMALNDEAARKTGYEQGLGLAIRRLLIKKDYSLANQLNQAKIANGGKEIPKEVRLKLEDLTTQLREAEKKLDEYEKRITELEAENKLKKESKKSSRKTDEEYKKERKNTIESIKKKWGDAGKQAYSAPPLAPQLIAIAPDVLKLAKSYAEQGVIKLSDVVTKVYNDLAAHIQGITEDDVRDMLVGKYDQKKTPPVLDRQQMTMKANVEKLKREINLEKEKLRLKNRTKGEKGIDFFHKWRRFALLSGVKVLGKIGVAATMRSHVVSPIEGAMGWLASKTKFGKGAPREGNFSPKAEAKAFAQWFDKMTYKDIRNIIKGEMGELDYLHHKELHPTGGWLEFPGQLHAAIKTLPKRAEYFRSLEMRAEFALKEGKDLTDPAVQEEITAKAYDDALRTIFMNENYITDAYKSLVTSLEKSDINGSSAAANILKFFFPIVKVPTNYVAEATSYMVGSVKAAFALRNGVKNLTPDQKDYIIRALKKQSIGAALIALGYFNPNLFGGYYTGKRKDSDELAATDIKLFGVTLPHWMSHTPMLEALQLGATLRRVNDNSPDKTIGNKFLAGLSTSAKGVSQQIPFVNTPGQISEAVSKTDAAEKFLFRTTQSVIEPQLLKEIAELADSGEKRSPETFVDQLKSGIPGLRSDVPLKPERKRFEIKEERGTRKREATKEENIKAEKEIDEKYSQRIKDVLEGKEGVYKDQWGDVTIDQNEAVKEYPIEELKKNEDDLKKVKRTIKEVVSKEVHKDFKY